MSGVSGPNISLNIEKFTIPLDALIIFMRKSISWPGQSTVWTEITSVFGVIY